jgi:two-component system sensor histidine kinase KdpD
MFNRTLTQQLLQRGEHLELVIVGTPSARARSRGLPSRRAAVFDRHDLTWTLVATSIALLVAGLAERWLGLEDLSMVFIVAVVLVAARTGMAAAVLSAGLCFLAYNFFFIEPRYTFEISARQGVATVVLFLLAALVAGRLASRLRLQVIALRAANAHATVLQGLGRQLGRAVDLAEVLHSGRVALERHLGADVWLQVDSATATSTGAALRDIDRAAVDWVIGHNQAAGRFTDTLAGASWWFVPLQAEKDVIGVAGLRLPAQATRLGIEQRRLAEAMVDDVAQAVVRTRLAADLEAARIGGETERLRSALLSSVSHDLRSPLAAMMGSAGSLSSYADAMDADDRKALLDMILVEGERLDRSIQNLLDMTRLGHAGLTLNRDWIGVDELIGSAVGRLRRYQPDIDVHIDVADGMPPLWVHPALVEQALFNVIENAAKFSPPGQAVDVIARSSSDGGAVLDIIDRGPGIPDDERARVFDIFYTVERGDRGRKGTGLGLTIAHGMIGAHGGRIEALAGADGRGTTVRIRLPASKPQPEQAGHDE